MRDFSFFTSSRLIRTLFPFCITYMLFIAGCRVIQVVPVDTKPNTFTFSDKHRYGSIYSVEVYHKNPQDEMAKIMWKIEATADVPLKGFSVTVGDVPDGFKQIVPTPPGKFHPNKGEEYLIDIQGRNLWPNADIFGKIWVEQ